MVAQREATTEQLRIFLDEYTSWSIKDKKLHREYVFDSFAEAFDFMKEAAICAERLDHHPDWANSCGTVVIDLTTHEAGGITERDFELAMMMEAIAARKSTG